MKNLMFILFSGIFYVSIAYSVNTTEIESLRSRVQGASSELTASDKGVISKFWSDALDEMLLSKSSNEIVEIRRQLESQKGDEFLSYYATAYIAQAKDDIQAAFKDVQRLENPPQRQMVEHNLMILTAKLQSPQLAPLALQHLEDKDDVVRYWAFKAVTQPAVIQQLTSDVTRDDKIIEAILNAMEQKALTELQPEIQEMAVSFCSAFDDSLARKVLLSIANMRINAYKDWTIIDESPDAVLLAVLGNIAELHRDPEIKKMFGRTFAELYALVIQRYSQGKDTFTPDHIDRLLTVILEVEKTVLNKTMKIPTNILKTIREGRGLDRECENLFGNKIRQGKLSEKFKFNYGTDASGKPITAPPQLGPKPEKSTKQD